MTDFGYEKTLDTKRKREYQSYRRPIKVTVTDDVNKSRLLHHILAGLLNNVFL